MTTDSAFLTGSQVILIDGAGSQTTLRSMAISHSLSIIFTRRLHKLKHHFRAYTVINVSGQSKNGSIMSSFFIRYF